MSDNNNAAVMAKTIGMFNVLTGKQLTEAEGFAFIGLWDIADEHVNGPQPQSPANELFDAATKVMDPPELDIPTFVGRDPAAGPDYTVIAKVVIDAAKTGTGAMMVGPNGVEHIDTRSMFKTPEEIADESVGDYDYTPEKQDEVEAAWQAREQMQAREAERDEVARQETERRIAAERTVNVTHRSHHQLGYDWQVCALCRSGVRSNSTIRLYRTEPTPQEFYELCKLYDQQTHWVFVNRWNPSMQRWDKHLDQYMQQNETAIRNLRGTIPRRPRTETSDAPLVGRDVSVTPVSDEWEQPEKAFRVRYYSDAAKGVTFYYVDKKPSGAEMAHFHHTKCLAVLQAKPTA